MKYYNKQEMADYLGLKISTIRAWWSTGSLPAPKKNGKWSEAQVEAIRKKKKPRVRGVFEKNRKQILKFFENGGSYREAAERFNLSEPTLRERMRIERGESTPNRSNARSVLYSEYELPKNWNIVQKAFDEVVR